MKNIIATGKPHKVDPSPCVSCPRANQSGCGNAGNLVGCLSFQDWVRESWRIVACKKEDKDAEN